MIEFTTNKFINRFKFYGQKSICCKEGLYLQTQQIIKKGKYMPKRTRSDLTFNSQPSPKRIKVSLTPNDSHFILDICNPKLESISKDQATVTVEEITNGLGNEERKEAKFIVNPIMYVDGDESDESSDEEYDSSEELQFAELDTGDKLTLPYHPFRITKSKAGKIKITTPVGFIKGQELLEVAPNIVEELGKSTVVQPFLDNLYNTGLESEDDGHIEQLVSASICLNRPISLSTRKNNLLTKELNAQSESPIVHSKFGIFWEYKWYDAENSLVEYNVVRTFYKKLKHYDLIHETSKAEEFRAICESGIAPPYQELREIAKNYTNTKALVTASRSSNSNADVYLSFIDGDTVSFNGIYSAYLRIINKHSVPTVMSTGYEFSEERIGEDYPLVVASQIDRIVRVETAKYIPLGVYYPEPNMCVLIPEGNSTIPESFISSVYSERQHQKLESAILLRQVANREHFIAIFSGDNPLITAIPARVRLEAKEFSNQFKEDHILTEEDKKTLSKISQSHFDPWQWAINLYMHRAFELLNPDGERGIYGKYRGSMKAVDPFHHPAKIYPILSKYISVDTIIQFVKAASDIQQKILVEKLGILRRDEIGSLFDQLAIEAKENIENIRLILPECCDINLIYRGYAPVHKTLHMHTENRELLFLLLGDCGVNPNIQDKRGDTLAHYAAEENDVELLKLLKSKDANFDIVNRSSRTALDYTAEHYRFNKEAYEFLLELSGQPIEEKIILAIKQGNVVRLEQYLQSVAVQTLNTETEKFGFIAHVACAIGNMQIISILAKTGCNFKAVSEDGATSLEEACYGDNADLNPDTRIELINYLINIIQVSITSRAVHNSLHCADSSILKLLLDKGANPDVLCSIGFTPLLSLINQTGIWPKTLEIIKLLLEYGADILMHEKYVGNSLHLAAERGHIKVSKLLIDHAIQNGLLDYLLQASPEECRVYGGINAYQIALKCNNIPVATMLEQYFPDDVLGINCSSLSSYMDVDDDTQVQVIGDE